MEITIVYTPCKNSEEAATIGKALIKEKLVACINVFPVISCYFWNDKITDDNEMVLLCKLLPENEPKVRKKIEKLHSYDVPAVLSWNVNINKEYYEWIKKNSN